MTTSGTAQQTAAEPQHAAVEVPLVIRGTVITADATRYETRRGGRAFMTPDVTKYLDQLTVPTPSALSDLHAIGFEEILTYLHDLGKRLSLDENRWLQQAFELSCETSGLPEPVIEHIYRGFPTRFDASRLRDIADRVIGIDYLEGWVPTELSDGTRFSVRAFGARTVHIVAGNLPLSAASSVIRNALTRGDAIIKSPSNDPATGAAIARTMADMAPGHPLTKHLSVAYWKGGDTAIESQLYHPARVEKIIAFGGEASMRHVRSYIQPGLELIALDPKLSSTIIGREALGDDAGIRDVARRLAMDVGGLNQEGCVNARVVYVESGTDPSGLERLRKLALHLYEEIQALPPTISGPARWFDPELRSSLEALATVPDYYELIGGTAGEGAVVVSLEEDPVDFANLLSGRVANLVPIDSLETAISAVNAYTQTIGIYPPGLKEQIRDRLALHGAQRLPTLGHAIDFQMATPQDGMETMRRMVKWIADEDDAGLPMAGTDPFARPGKPSSR
jgi:hypothetical protein